MTVSTHPPVIDMTSQPIVHNQREMTGDIHHELDLITYQERWRVADSPEHRPFTRFYTHFTDCEQSLNSICPRT